MPAGDGDGTARGNQRQDGPWLSKLEQMRHAWMCIIAPNRWRYLYVLQDEQSVWFYNNEHKLLRCTDMQVGRNET
jgi:hypothetical protein